MDAFALKEKSADILYYLLSTHPIKRLKLTILCVDKT